jgi:hypothetical protein
MALETNVTPKSLGSSADDRCLDYILHLERHGRSCENKFPDSTPGQRLHEAT